MDAAGFELLSAEALAMSNSVTVRHWLRLGQRSLRTIDVLAAHGVDVGWGRVADALVVPEIIVVGDEVADLPLRITG